MLISLIRAVILYLALILVVRLMGKRQLGEMEPMEFVVTMLIANLAAVPMQETGTPLLAGLLPILVVLSVELVLSVVTYRSVGMRRFLCGKPVILIENGRLLQQNLKKTQTQLRFPLSPGAKKASVAGYDAQKQTDGDCPVLVLTDANGFTGSRSFTVMYTISGLASEPVSS